MELRTTLCLCICGIALTAPAFAQQGPWTTIGPDTPGVAEYLITLQPASTPGLYTPKFTPIPLGSTVTVELSGTPFTPGSGCFVVGGDCASSDPSAFDFLAVKFSSPVNGLMTQESSGSLYWISFLANGQWNVACGGCEGFYDDNPILSSFQIGGEPTAVIESLAFSRVPEPGTLPLLALGLAGIGYPWRRLKVRRYGRGNTQKN